MGERSGPPSSGQREGQLAPWRWELVADERTQRVIRICVARFIRRHPAEDAAEAQGVALDETIKAAAEYVREAGPLFHNWLQPRITYALNRDRWRRWRRSLLLAEKYEQPDDPLPDAWELLEAAERLRLAAVALEVIDRLPFDHAHLLRSVYVEGRSVNSVARELGKSRSAGSRLHHDALTRLRVLLAKKRFNVTP